MSLELHNTIMGRRLIEGTLPNLVHQLSRIADSLEKLTESKSVSPNIDETLHMMTSFPMVNPFTSESDVKPKVKGEGTAKSVLDYVESMGSVTHKEMQEYYKSLNGSNTFAYCLKNLIIPYKNRKTQRYLVKLKNGRYEVRTASIHNWVVKEY
jgi:hypothetical protein